MSGLLLCGQVRVKEGVRRRSCEEEEEKVRSEKRAEEWIQQKRQEKLKEQTVCHYAITLHILDSII